MPGNLWLLLQNLEMRVTEVLDEIMVNSDSYFEDWCQIKHTCMQREDILQMNKYWEDTSRIQVD